MTDWHGKGRWGTGDRPLTSGPEQSAYDAGAQQRRFEEERRLREQRDQQERARKQQEEWRRKDRELAQSYGQGSETRAPTETRYDPEDEIDFDALLKLGATVALTYFLIKLWGMATGSLAPSNDILAAIVEHGVWGVALLGIGLGIRFQERLLPIAKVGFVLLVLFFGSAIVVGIYRGLTG